MSAFAGRVLDAVARDRPRVLVGTDAELPDLLVRLAPASLPRAVAALARRCPGLSWRSTP